MDLFIKNFEIHIESILKNYCNKTEDGKTQEAERNLKRIILSELNKYSETPVEEAGQQQAIDFRNFCYQGQFYNFECKKSDSGTNFKFNDTMVKSEVYYIFNYEKYKKIRIIKGSDIFLLTLGSRLSGSLIALKELINNKVVDKNFVIELFNLTLSFAQECVFNGIISLFDYGELFKRTIKFGNAVSRPRPNWNISVPLL
jgi:hypothetical protein